MNRHPRPISGLNSKGDIQRWDGFAVSAHSFCTLLALSVCVGTLAGAGQVTEYASAQLPLISVTTDKTDYVGGDTVIIYGNLSASILDTPVILQIFKGQNPVYINQITPAEDMTYWDIVRADGDKWKNSGEYEVKVRYGKDGKATTIFNFTSRAESEVPGLDDPAEPDIFTGSFEVDAGSETFDVSYIITGGTVENMELDWQDFTLIIDINATALEGSITMDLPRKYIGAESSDGTFATDEVFIVLAGDTEIAYDEPVALQASRQITVDFLEGDSQIRVIGTYAVPEFSHVAIIVMLGGVLAVVVLAGRTHGMTWLHGPELFVRRA